MADAFTYSRLTRHYIFDHTLFESSCVTPFRSTQDDDVLQQRSKKAGSKDAVASSNMDDEYSQRKGSENTYYSIAHTLREPVSEQPSIVVNGRLKEYQVGVVGAVTPKWYMYTCIYTVFSRVSAHLPVNAHPPFLVILWFMYTYTCCIYMRYTYTCTYGLSM